MDTLDTFVKIISSNNSQMAGWSILTAVLVGVWKLALKFLNLLSNLFKETKEEISQTKELFMNLTREVERLNGNLERNMELASQRFDHIEQRLERLEDCVDVIREKI